jgi:hypothetical protein
LEEELEFEKNAHAVNSQLNDFTSDLDSLLKKDALLRNTSSKPVVQREHPDGLVETDNIQ